MQATYKGISGDSKVVDMFGLTFFQGQPVDISGLPGEQRAKLAANPNFTVTGVEAPKRGRGRPPKAAEPAVEPGIDD